MKLLNNEESLWDKEIDVRLTLRELQELYCALGMTSLCDRIQGWNNCSSSNCPFDNIDNGDNLYSDMEEILKEQGGQIL